MSNVYSQLAEQKAPPVEAKFKFRTLFTALAATSLLATVGVFTKQSLAASNEIDTGIKAADDDCKCDVLFVLDGSCSIQPEDFTKMKTFVSEVINRPTVAQTGFMMWNAEMFTPMASLGDKSTTLAGIANLKQCDSGQTCCGTYTHQALPKAENILVQSRPFKCQVMLVITDGQTFYHAPGDKTPETISTANAIKARHPDWRIFALGVGRAKSTELNAIASQPSYAIRLRNFAQLATMAFDIPCTLR
eukprot:NODE_4351_length_802_cov_9.885926_g4193_i0.p1 GENE.NODE_4351_length_802_cov_9.885926_g4193_i0~~NODE_4351_length_802_cov_9.885926_g4193_i0.p1  ORF type:complete len:247 (-),score=33.69 NODE_4351_length_802_cov_9.885926_g4193_i0:3-743(-)